MVHSKTGAQTDQLDLSLVLKVNLEGPVCKGVELGLKTIFVTAWRGAIRWAKL
jgi:hypothetical protein